MFFWKRDIALKLGSGCEFDLELEICKPYFFGKR